MLAQLEPRNALPLTQTVVEMVPPLVLDERLVSLFKYWNQGIHQGMRHNSELYTLFQTFPVDERLRAYAVGYEQTERGTDVCITVSKTTYCVWLNLRSLSHAAETHLAPQIER